MLKTSKTLSTLFLYKYSKNFKDITMDNQQETNKNNNLNVYFLVGSSETTREAPLNTNKK